MYSTIFTSAIILLLLDSIYLYVFTQFFNNTIQKVQNSPTKINLFSAFLCYLLLIAGLNYFIISANKSPFDAFLFGIIIYGVYETTNYSIFSQWPIYMVIIDTLWGGILLAITTFLTYLINK